jgi:death-on-curing protein
LPGLQSEGIVNDLLFLTLDEVLQIHSYQIKEHGGAGEIRDIGLLKSAIAQPRQAIGGSYLHEGVAAMAAAYLFHIVQNHAFEDGNKRTGTHTAIVFLEMNGYPLDLPEETEQLVIAVAAGKKNKNDVTDFIQKLLKVQLFE